MLMFIDLFNCLFVQDIFGVDPTGLRSPINRPTKVMRELYKNSGYELLKWKEYLEPNESVLKGKCFIIYT